MTTIDRVKILRLDAAMTTFLASLEWPDGVPAPEADLAVASDGVPRVRFVRPALAPAESQPAVFSSVGPAPIDMIAGLALLAEEWVKIHDADPGTYPSGVRGQLVTKLDMRTAAAWLYSVQLAAALGSAS